MYYLCVVRTFEPHISGQCCVPPEDCMYCARFSQVQIGAGTFVVGSLCQRCSMVSAHGVMDVLKQNDKNNKCCCCCCVWVCFWLVVRLTALSCITQTSYERSHIKDRFHQALTNFGDSTGVETVDFGAWRPKKRSGEISGKKKHLNP